MQTVVYAQLHEWKHMCVIREFMCKDVYVHRKLQNSFRAQTDKKRSVKNFIPTNTEFCMEEPECIKG